MTISEICDHLLATVPKLKYHSISKANVACLTEPPRHGTIASKRYKGLIAARCLASALSTGKTTSINTTSLHMLFVEKNFNDVRGVMIRTR